MLERAANPFIMAFKFSVYPNRGRPWDSYIFPIILIHTRTFSFTHTHTPFLSPSFSHITFLSLSHTNTHSFFHTHTHRHTLFLSHALSLPFIFSFSFFLIFPFFLSFFLSLPSLSFTAPLAYTQNVLECKHIMQQLIRVSNCSGNDA